MYFCPKTRLMSSLISFLVVLIRIYYKSENIYTELSLCENSFFTLYFGEPKINHKLYLKLVKMRQNNYWALDGIHNKGI